MNVFTRRSANGERRGEKDWDREKNAQERGRERGKESRRRVKGEGEPGMRKGSNRGWSV